MSKNQIFILIMLAVIMVVVAMALGNWSQQINPDGIAAHPEPQGNTAIEQNTPRDAYSFGVSIGLLGCALVYCCLAFGMLISARSKGLRVSWLTYWIAGIAGLGFALSYLIDDYFY